MLPLAGICLDRIAVMSQIFHPSTNTISRVSIFGAVFILAAVLLLIAELNRSSYNTQAGVAREQPVQFSHKHHVADDGIDCRYCPLRLRHRHLPVSRRPEPA